MASNTVAIVAIALHAVCSECVQKKFSAAVKIFCYYYLLFIHHCTHCILRRILSTISHIAMCDERRDEQLCIKCIAAGAKRKKEAGCTVESAVNAEVMSTAHQAES